MLITEEVELSLNPRNIARLESLGYNIPREIDSRGRNRVKPGTKIMVKTADLSIGSHCKVAVSCDYCGKISIVSYKDYLRHHDSELGDCCVQCRAVKYKRTMNEKYGVDNINQLEEFVEKRKATCREKYGADYGLCNKAVREKIENTMTQRYGVVHPLQVEDFLEKALTTRASNYCTVSKPQRKMYEMLKEKYPDTELEFPCGRCSLDCLVRYGGVSIDVEYDGLYWHQDRQRDRRRDNFIRSKGYKILRVRANKFDELPTIEALSKEINRLASGYNYAEIIM